MATSTNPVTMGEYALLSQNPQIMMPVFSLIDNGSIMARDIPWKTRKLPTVTGLRWTGNLPAFNWAGINTAPAPVKGAPTPYSESLYLIRNSIDVDKIYVEAENNLGDPREAQLEAYLKSVAFGFNNAFFNNDHLTGDTNGIVGLRGRIDNPTQYGVRSAAKIDAGGLDMTLATITTPATSGKGNQFFELLNQLLWAVDAPMGGPNVVIYANDQFLRRIDTSIRAMGTSGGFAITQDQFERSVITYKGCRMEDPGYLGTDQTVRIITSTEANTGVAGSSTYTSVYAVNYGPGHFGGWQFDDLSARDLGILNDGETYRTVIDWAGGLINDSDRSIGRIYDLKIS